MLFFKVTEALFSRLFAIYSFVLGIITPIIGSLTIVFVVIITIGLSKTKNKKKFISNNFIVFLIVIAAEALIALLFNNIEILKLNLITIIICLFILVYRLKPKKIKKKNKLDNVVDAEIKVKKSEEVKEDE